MNASRPYRSLGRLLTASPIASHALVALVAVACTGSLAFAAAAARNSVVSSSIKDGAVKSVDIKNGDVATIDLKTRAVTGPKIAPGAVTSAAIADGAVTAADLAPGTLPAAELTTGSVTSAIIADGTISASDLAAGAVTNTKIANDAIDSARIIDGTIKGDDVADESLPITKLDTLGGSDGQILAISGGNTSWVTPAYEPRGVRSVRVRAGDTSSANGAALRSAVQGLSSPSVTNRWLVEVEPGDYDIGSTPIIIPDGVTIAGASSVARDVTVTGTGTSVFEVQAGATAGLASMQLDRANTTGTVAVLEVAGALEARNLRSTFNSSSGDASFLSVTGAADVTVADAKVVGVGGAATDIALATSSAGTTAVRFQDSAADLSSGVGGTAPLFFGDGAFFVSGRAFGTAYHGEPSAFAGSSGGATYQFTDADLQATVTLGAGDSFTGRGSLVTGAVGGAGSALCYGVINTFANTMLNTSCA